MVFFLPLHNQCLGSHYHYHPVKAAFQSTPFHPGKISASLPHLPDWAKRKTAKLIS